MASRSPHWTACAAYCPQLLSWGHCTVLWPRQPRTLFLVAWVLPVPHKTLTCSPQLGANVRVHGLGLRASKQGWSSTMEPGHPSRHIEAAPQPERLAWVLPLESRRQLCIKGKTAD
eukprot:365817-Chlamydomonas_euryale.AAC.22